MKKVHWLCSALLLDRLMFEKVAEPYTNAYHYHTLNLIRHSKRMVALLLPQTGRRDENVVQLTSNFAPSRPCRTLPLDRHETHVPVSS